MAIMVDKQFDSGNIEVIRASNPADIAVAITKDASSEFLQWFHFSVSGVRHKPCQISIVNAAQTTYPKGWEGYDVATSTDRQTWYRTPAQYDGQSLSWRVTPETDVIWFAYFAPYSMQQHADLIAAAASADGVAYQNLGQTHLGRSIDYLHVSAMSDESVDDAANASQIADSESVRKQLWVIARQHPGESMAQWWVEGWLDRLLDQDDATSRALRQVADIHVVPNMNPDGSYLGHLRTNALGVNLNREWAEPSMQRSPEVFVVKQQMQQTGIDLCLDVHGDEALPYNFIAGTEGISDWTDERDAELVALKHTWASLNPDFQVTHGYPKNTRGNANLAICSNNLAASFGALAMTLEMPFKDTADTPRPLSGWSAERSLRLGASFVDVAYLALTQRLMKPGR